MAPVIDVVTDALMFKQYFPAAAALNTLCTIIGLIWISASWFMSSSYVLTVANYKTERVQ